MRIPAAAFALGLAGVVPFAVPVLALALDLPPPLGVPWPAIQSFYALTILSFMSGALWGGAAMAEDAAGYALSTLPALGGFFVFVLVYPSSVGTAELANILFCILFIALLALDKRAASLGQMPAWWMGLRLRLTGLVVLCLAAGVVI